MAVSILYCVPLYLSYALRVPTCDEDDKDNYALRVQCTTYTQLKNQDDTKRTIHIQKKPHITN